MPARRVPGPERGGENVSPDEASPERAKYNVVVHMEKLKERTSGPVRVRVGMRIGNRHPRMTSSYPRDPPRDWTYPVRG